MTKAMAVDAVVIGAGHNGLISGCYLAQAGHRVLVVEASELIGGMTSRGRSSPKRRTTSSIPARWT